MAFFALIEKEGRFYVAHSTELPVTSQGESMKEAIANLKEAVELYLEYAEPDELGGLTREEFIRLHEGNKDGPMTTQNPSRIADLLFEAGLLKTVSRTGWDTIRAPRESVAEHSFRTALVGWVLAKMAHLSEQEEASLIKACLFHDLHESRIGDLHRLAKLYGKLDEKKCESDQREGLPSEMKDDLMRSLSLLSPRLKQFAFEADKIECAITAKEYLDAGYRTSKWIEHTQKEAVKSKEGKLLLKAVLSRDSSAWFLQDSKWNSKRKK